MSRFAIGKRLGYVVAVCALVFPTAGGPAPRLAMATNVFAVYPDCSGKSQGPSLSGTLIDNPKAPALATKLQSILESDRTLGNIPGISYALVYGQGAITGGVGCANAQIQKKTPAVAGTVYEIASNTKLFTATMMMQLRDAKQLNITDQVNAKVPDAWWYLTENGAENKTSASYQDLASYDSGLPDDSTGSPPSTTSELWSLLNSTHTTLAPGASYVYSDLGFAVLGQAMADAIGQSGQYESYVETNILHPLGMTMTGFTLSESMASDFATGYDSNGGAVSYQGGRGSYSPAGGLLSTATDMAKFVQMQFGTGAAGGAQVLGCNSVHDMWTQVISDDMEGGAATGWLTEEVNGQPAIWKNGLLPGYSSLITVVPDLQLGLVLLINLSNADDLTGPAKMNNVNSAVMKAAVSDLGIATDRPSCGG